MSAVFLWNPKVQRHTQFTEDQRPYLPWKKRKNNVQRSQGNRERACLRRNLKSGFFGKERRFCVFRLPRCLGRRERRSGAGGQKEGHKQNPKPILPVQRLFTMVLRVCFSFFILRSLPHTDFSMRNIPHTGLSLFYGIMNKMSRTCLCSRKFPVCTGLRLTVQVLGGMKP